MLDPMAAMSCLLVVNTVGAADTRRVARFRPLDTPAADVGGRRPPARGYRAGGSVLTG